MIKNKQSASLIVKAKPFHIDLVEDLGATRILDYFQKQDIITERKSIADELEIIYYVLNLYHQYLPKDTASSVDALKQLAKELRENGK